MLIDAKKLWVEGGYGIHNPYEIFISRVRQQAKAVEISENELELILIDFFISLRKDPMMYRTEGNVCLQCNCEITNSGTNATHYIFRKIDEAKKQNLKTQEKVEVDGVLIPKKLINRNNTKVCSRCSKYSFRTKDELYLNKFNVCYKCYVCYIEENK